MTSRRRSSPASARGTRPAARERRSLRRRAERGVEHAPGARTGDGVLDRDQVARAREHELEGARGVRLDVVAAQLQRLARRRVRARDRGECEVVAGLAYEAQVHGLVVRLRALDVREGAHGPAEPLLEAELGDRDLARGLVELEIGERLVSQAMRLDAHAQAIELGELAPVDGAVEDPVSGEVFLVRERLAVADVRE